MKDSLKAQKGDSPVDDDEAYQSDQSDYSLEDFPDLTGSFVEESHVRVFFEKEMEKIENDPHRIERVKAIKEAVANYYELKGDRGV